MPVSPLRIGVVDDHRAISAGLPLGLAAHLPPRSTFTDALTVAELLSAGRAFDVVLLDINLADSSVPEDNVRAVVAAGCPVLLYTAVEQPGRLARCLRAGALGVVGKHQEWPTLAEAILVAARGEPFLNADWAAAMEAVSGTGIPHLARREAEVLRLYAAGLPLRVVAEHMHIAEDTAREYLGRVRAKYAEVARPAPTKTDLYRRADEDGHLDPPSGGSTG